MSGYNIQNQSFAVSLNSANTLQYEIAFLKSTMLAPTTNMLYDIFTGSSTELSSEQLLGGFILFTGSNYSGNYNLSPGLVPSDTQGPLPFAVDLYNAWKARYLALYGNQIYNIPDTQREFLTAPTPGDNVTFKIWNNTPGQLVFDPTAGDPNYISTGPYVIKPFLNGIFQLTVLDASIPLIAFSNYFP